MYLSKVEQVNSKHDITCHSKSRRNKKKKIPLVNNEEVDMDLSQEIILLHHSILYYKVIGYPSLVCPYYVHSDEYRERLDRSFYNYPGNLLLVQGVGFWLLGVSMQCIIIGDYHQFIGHCLIPLDP